MRADLAVAQALVARTVALDGDFDLALVAGDDGVLWEQDGAGFAGRGVAARVPVAPGGLGSGGLAPGGLGSGGLGSAALAQAGDEVSAVLGDIEVEGDLAPLAFGALPFSPSVGGELVVPQVLVRREVDGSCWLTVTGPTGAPVRSDEIEASLRQGSAAVAAAIPDWYSVTTKPSHAQWCQLVGRAVRAIRAGQLSKVVLAREVEVVANRAFSVTEVVRRLRVLHPSCMIFTAGGFVGASPELLVARSGDRVRSHPLAGTTVASGDPVADGQWGSELLASSKDREEHRLAVDAVVVSLAPFCTELAVPDRPTVMALGNLAHLGTPIEGTLRRPLPSVLDLVGAIHPSPAVAGVPRAAALAFIDAEEGIDRGRYAGPVGWVDGAGNGQWALAIRSAELSGHRARLFAGNGLVAGSDPAAELAETQLKLQSMLGAIVRP
ncbi:MAG: isochorismate synthase [Acidimicrobiales bacterium]|nr:MAG: isochorismate synthase [Acidimicrobiales bacterium]